MLRTYCYIDPNVRLDQGAREMPEGSREVAARPARLAGGATVYVLPAYPRKRASPKENSTAGQGQSGKDEGVAGLQDDVVLGALAGDDRLEVDLEALVGVAALVLALPVVAQHDDLALGVGGQPAGHGQDLHELGARLEVEGAGRLDLAGDEHLARVDLLDDHRHLGRRDVLPELEGQLLLEGQRGHPRGLNIAEERDGHPSVRPHRHGDAEIRALPDRDLDHVADPDGIGVRWIL